LLSFGLLLIVIAVGLCLSSFLFFQNELQKFADDLALSGACQLNMGDRIGQMNNLVSRCRQLVVASRQVAESSIGSSPELQTLSEQLLEEAQQNAEKLEAERARLQKLSLAETTGVVNNLYSQNKGHYNLSFPWLTLKTNDLVSTKFATIKGIDSNVNLVNGIAELAEHDRSKRYVNTASQLYVGSINAQLPRPDGHLTFKLASLPAPVRGQIAPARLVQSSELDPTAANDQIPSAVKVDIEASFANRGFSPSASVLKVSSCAATNGASQAIR